MDSPSLLIRLLVAASAALGPVVRRFISLGLNRVWLESGDVAYRQGRRGAGGLGYFRVCEECAPPGQLRVKEGGRAGTGAGQHLRLRMICGRREGDVVEWWGMEGWLLRSFYPLSPRHKCQRTCTWTESCPNPRTSLNNPHLCAFGSHTSRGLIAGVLAID